MQLKSLDNLDNETKMYPFLFWKTVEFLADSWQEKLFQVAPQRTYPS